MAQFSSPLKNIKIAAPCSADWNAMVGNDRVRFCGQCQLNVYNLSGYTQPEAEQLIARNEGRLCVRYYRRADGSVLTQNCPTGLQAARQKVSRWATAALSAVLSFVGGVGVSAAWRGTAAQQPTAYEAPKKWPDFVPLVRKKPEPPVLMGAMVPVHPTAPPTPKLQNLLYEHKEEKEAIKFHR